jgi:hypothetical protein
MSTLTQIMSRHCRLLFNSDAPRLISSLHVTLTEAVSRCCECSRCYGGAKAKVRRITSRTPRQTNTHPKMSTDLQWLLIRKWNSFQHKGGNGPIFSKEKVSRKWSLSGPSNGWLVWERVQGDEGTCERTGETRRTDAVSSFRGR